MKVRNSLRSSRTRQGLPRHPPPRPDLCHQQEEPPFQSRPGLKISNIMAGATLKLAVMRLIVFLFVFDAAGGAWAAPSSPLDVLFAQLHAAGSPGGRQAGRRANPGAVSPIAKPEHRFLMTRRPPPSAGARHGAPARRSVTAIASNYPKAGTARGLLQSQRGRHGRWVSCKKAIALNRGSSSDGTAGARCWRITATGRASKCTVAPRRSTATRGCSGHIDALSPPSRARDMRRAR